VIIDNNDKCSLENGMSREIEQNKYNMNAYSHTKKSAVQIKQYIDSMKFLYDTCCAYVD